MNDIPTTWTTGYKGVMRHYESPSGNQHITANYKGWYDWYMNGKTGEAEYISECIKQMGRCGMIEGEFI